MQRNINISTISPLTCCVIALLIIVFLPVLLVVAVVLAILWRFFGVRFPNIGTYHARKRPSSPRNSATPKTNQGAEPPASEDVIDVEAHEVNEDTHNLSQ